MKNRKRCGRALVTGCISELCVAIHQCGCCHQTSSRIIQSRPFQIFGIRKRIYPLIVLVHGVVSVLVVHPQGGEREAHEAGGEAEHGDDALCGVLTQVAQGYRDVVSYHLSF